MTSALAGPLRSSRWRRSQSSLLCKIPLLTPTRGSLPLRTSVWCALPSSKPARLRAAGVLGLGWRCAAPIRAPFGVSAAQVVGVGGSGRLGSLHLSAESLVLAPWLAAAWRVLVYL